MEKINITELLRNCPKGMELDCTMFENITFEEVVTEVDCDGNENISIVLATHYNDGMVDKIILTEYGTYTSDETAKCVIFPKGKTTWEGFVPPYKFKDGDIVISTNNNIHLISCRDKNNGWESCCGIIYDKFDSTKTAHVIPIRIATKEEKAKLFQAIKDNGYRWNAETKTLEELPQFKVGDKVREKGDEAAAFTISDIDDLHYYCGEHVICNICDQDEWELVPVEPKFKVGNKIVNTLRKHMGASMTQGVILEITDDKYIFIDGSYISINDQDSWELVPNKFDITTLKPFDRVLGRDKNTDKWLTNFWGFYDNSLHFPYKCCGNSFAQCIPYKGNEHLCGTTNDCDDFYKTWE